MFEICELCNVQCLRGLFRLLQHSMLVVYNLTKPTFFKILLSRHANMSSSVHISIWEKCTIKVSHGKNSFLWLSKWEKIQFSWILDATCGKRATPTTIIESSIIEQKFQALNNTFLPMYCCAPTTPHSADPSGKLTPGSPGMIYADSYLVILVTRCAYVGLPI